MKNISPKHIIFTLGLLSLFTSLLFLFPEHSKLQSSLLESESTISQGSYEIFQRYNTSIPKDHWSETFSGAVMRNFDNVDLRSLSMSTLIWNKAQKLPGFMEMFRTYNDTTYLDQLISIFEEFMKNENFNDRDGDGRRDWMSTVPDDYSIEKLMNGTFWDYDTPASKSLSYDFETPVSGLVGNIQETQNLRKVPTKALHVKKSDVETTRIPLTNIVPGAYHVITFNGKSNGKPELQGFGTVMTKSITNGQETFTKVSSHWPPVRSPGWEIQKITFQAPTTPLYLDFGFDDESPSNAEMYIDDIRVGSVAISPTEIARMDRFIPLLWKPYATNGATLTTNSVRRNYSNTGSVDMVYGTGAILKNNGQGIIGIQQELVYYSPKRTYEIAYLGQTSSENDTASVRLRDLDSDQILGESTFSGLIPNMAADFGTAGSGACTGKFSSYKNFKKFTVKMPESDTRSLAIEIQNTNPNTDSTVGINCITMRQTSPMSEFPGLILMPIAEFILEVQRNPSLAQYKETANRYRDFIVNEILPTYEPHIKTLPGTDMMVEYYHSRDYQGVNYYADEITTPHNKFMPLLRVFLTMSEVTGNQGYREIAVGVGKMFKSTLTVKEKNGKEYYVWNYSDNIQPQDNHFLGAEDVSHANLTLGGVFSLYEAGLVFDKKDMERFINTFFEVVYFPTVQVECGIDANRNPIKKTLNRILTWKVDGMPNAGWDNAFEPDCTKNQYSDRPIWEWIRMSAYDRRMWLAFENSYRNSTSSDMPLLGRMAAWDQAKIRNSSFFYTDLKTPGASEWIKSGSGGTIVRTTDQKEILSVPASINISKDTSEDSISMYQDVKVTQGQEQYHLYFHSKNTSGTKGQVKVHSQSGATLLSQEISATRWTPQGYAIYVPSGVTSLRVEFELTKNTNGALYLDDIYLFPKKEEVIINYIPPVQQTNTNSQIQNINLNTNSFVLENSNSIQPQNINLNTNVTPIQNTNSYTIPQYNYIFGGGGYSYTTDPEENSSIPRRDDTGSIEDDLRSAAPSVTFQDIQGHFAKDAVLFLSKKGILKGRTPTQFVPNGQLNRSEAATLIVRALGKENESAEFLKNFKTKNPMYTYVQFTDVPTNSWFASAVGYLAEKGVIKGRSDREYASSESITRAEFIKLLLSIETNHQSAIFGDASFTDVKNADWYFNSINDAYRKGIIINAKTFRPNAPITRGEAASALAKILQNM